MEDFIHTKRLRESLYRFEISSKKGNILFTLLPDSILVMGYMIKKHYKKTPEGLQTSKIKPIDVDEQLSVEDLIKDHYAKKRDKYLNKTRLTDSAYKTGKEFRVYDDGKQNFIFW